MVRLPSGTFDYAAIVPDPRNTDNSATRQVAAPAIPSRSYRTKPVAPGGPWLLHFHRLLQQITAPPYPVVSGMRLAPNPQNSACRVVHRPAGDPVYRWADNLTPRPSPPPSLDFPSEPEALYCSAPVSSASGNQARLCPTGGLTGGLARAARRSPFGGGAFSSLKPD